MTYFSLFEGLKFQAPLTKERLKLVLGLKFFSQGNPTKMWISADD
jgi:hypothetical protein